MRRVGEAAAAIVRRLCDERHDPPMNVLGLPDGKLEYDMRIGFRDLCRLHGFDEARRIIAEIINAEAEGNRL